MRNKCIVGDKEKHWTQGYWRKKCDWLPSGDGCIKVRTVADEVMKPSCPDRRLSAVKLVYGWLRESADYMNMLND